MAATVELYRRFPLLFALLAAAVVVPYSLLVLALTGRAPLGVSGARASTVLILDLLDVALVGPLISALHVHAVRMIGRGERPGLRAVALGGLAALPVVVAAQIVAGLGIAIGLLAFIVPGILLAIRWAVVAQVAAIERPDWIGALRRSAELTRGHAWHVFGLLIMINLIAFGLIAVASVAAGTSDHAPQVVVGIVVQVLTRSFTALATAVLYFDLLARARGASPARGAEPDPPDAPQV